VRIIHIYNIFCCSVARCFFLREHCWQCCWRWRRRWTDWRGWKFQWNCQQLRKHRDWIISRWGNANKIKSARRRFVSLFVDFAINSCWLWLIDVDLLLYFFISNPSCAVHTLKKAQFIKRSKAHNLIHFKTNATAFGKATDDAVEEISMLLSELSVGILIQWIFHK